MAKNSKNIIADDDSLSSADWQLFTGFDGNGNPQYKPGQVTDQQELQQLKKLVNELRQSKTSYSAVKMGTIKIKICKRRSDRNTVGVQYFGRQVRQSRSDQQ